KQGQWRTDNRVRPPGEPHPEAGICVNSRFDGQDCPPSTHPAVDGRYPSTVTRVYAFPMKLRVGTSGYSYKEWKGIFYPDDLPAAKMLPYYAERFDTVEINN